MAAVERSLVTRAAVAGIAGGAVVAVVAGSFGPRFFAADVRVWGIGVGVLACLLLLGPLVSGRVPPGWGALVIVLGIVAIPVAAGGLVVGSLLLVASGVVLASVVPAPAGTTTVSEPASRLRRLVAGVGDAALTVAAVLLLAAGPLSGWLAGTDRVFVLWAAAWLAITVPAAVLLSATPGEWLAGAGTRAVGRRRAAAGSGDVLVSGGAVASRRGAVIASHGGVVARHLLRGVVAIGLPLVGLVVALRAGPVASGAAATAVVLALVAPLVLRPRWIDELTGTAPQARRVVAGS